MKRLRSLSSSRLTTAVRRFRPSILATSAAALLALCATSLQAKAQLFVSDGFWNVGKYDASTGAAINASFITGLNDPSGIAISGNDLFVASFATGNVSRYNVTTGALIDAAFITGANRPTDLVVSGNRLYLTSFLDGNVKSYDVATGSLVSTFATGLTDPYALTISGSDLYVASRGGVGKYNALTGAAIDSSLFALESPYAMVVAGDALLVTNGANNTIGQYDEVTGFAISTNFITGLNGPSDLLAIGSNVLVTNRNTNSIASFSATGGPVSTFITGMFAPKSLALIENATHWLGQANGTWTGANWASDAAGTATIATPTAASDLLFSATGAANQNTTLGANFTIHNLTIQDSAAVTIGGANTLTIDSSSAQAIAVNSGAGLFTVSAGLTLAGSANTIAVNNAAGMIVSGAFNSSIGLVKNGTGTLALTNIASLTGGATVNAGTLQLGSGLAATGFSGRNGVYNADYGEAGGSAVLVQNGAALEVRAQVTLTGGAGGTSDDYGGTGGFAVGLANGGTLTNAGTLSGGAGAFAEGAIGDGGHGGDGVVIAGAGSVVNTGTIQGGNGGKNAEFQSDGSGGIGGDGIYFVNAGGTVTNSGTISGGNGGLGGTDSGYGGMAGNGIYFAAGGSVTNSGTISAGHAAAGADGVGLNGNAITNFGGGLTFVNSSGGIINGDIYAGAYSNSVTLETGSKINGNLYAGDTALTLTGSGTQLYSDAVTGNTSFQHALIEEGTGTWTLDRTFYHQGGTAIRQGTLKLGVANALPADTDMVLGTTSSSTTGTLDLAGSALTVNSIALASGNTGGTGNTITSSTTTAAFTVDSTTTSSTFAGAFGGSLALVKAGAGTALNLTGSSTHTGGTTVNAGALLANNTTGSATGGGSVVVNAGGVLGGSGTIAGAITLHGSSTLSPGATGLGSVGTLHGTSLTWDALGAMEFELGATSDQLALSGSLTKGTAGTYAIAVIDAGMTLPQYSLITFASTTFTQADLSLFSLALPTGYYGKLLLDADSLDLLLQTTVSGPVLQNSAPVGTPTTANFVVDGPVTTGGGVAENNQVNSLTFLPGSSLLIHNTLFVTEGPATLVNGSSVQLDGSLSVSQLKLLFGSWLHGNGSILGNLFNSGLVSPGNSPGEIHVTGDYTQTSEGTLRIEIGGRHSGQYDRLIVDGSAHLDGTLELVRLNKFKVRRGDKFTFLTAGGGVHGEFAEISNGLETGTILEPTVVYGDTHVTLEVERGSFEDYADRAGLTPNQRSVAAGLDSVSADEPNDKALVYLDERQLSKLPGDFDKIAPEELSSIFTISTSLANVQGLNLQRRTDDLRHGSSGFSAGGLAMQGTGPGYSGSWSGGGVAGPTGQESKESKTIVVPDEKKWGAFLTGTGEWVDVGGDGNARGYDITTGGFTLGLDYKVCPNFAIGIAAGYAGTAADLTDDGRVWVNGGKLGLYATTFVGGWYADVAVTGGYNSYDTKRSALQGTARGSTDGGELNVLVGTGFDCRFGGLQIGPTATFQYTLVGMDGFTEHGSLAPLEIAGRNAESVRSALGFKASYDWKLGGVLIKPEIRAAWQHEYGDRSYDISAGFASGAGDRFLVNGPEIGRDSLLLGAGFAIQCSETVSTYVYYDGELGRDRYDSHSVSAGVRIAF